MVRLLIFLLSEVLVLAACGPKVSLKPALPQLPEHFVQAPEETLPRIPEAWWKTLGSAELAQLVEQALACNHELRKAAARVAELQARAQVTRSQRFPQASVELTGERARPNFGGRFGGFSGGFIYGQWQGTLRASYEVDLFRRLAAAEKASRLESLAAEEDRQALALTLAAETATAYVQAAFAYCELEVLQEELSLSQKRLDFLRARFGKGLLSAPEWLTEKKRHLLLAAQIPLLREELIEAKQRLEILTGRYPAGQLPLRELPRLCRIKLPPPPAGLPSELLRRRPDIRAAEVRLKAAAERVRSARGNRFPHLVLTAEEGRVSPALKDLLLHRNRFWNLLSSLTQTIFDTGGRAAQETAARLALKEALEDYAQTVLTAFSEVEKALSAETRLRRNLAHQEEALEQLRQRVTFLAGRERVGILSIPEYLEARMALSEVRREVLRQRRALLENRIFLYRALAGGFGSPSKKGVRS